jgi:hypothetical protein
MQVSNREPGTGRRRERRRVSSCRDLESVKPDLSFGSLDCLLQAKISLQDLSASWDFSGDFWILQSDVRSGCGDCAVKKEY